MLVRKLWDGQMTGEPEPGHAGHLFAPVPGLHRVRGRFSDQARTRVRNFDASRLRLAVGIAAVAALLGLAALVVRLLL